jgi:regulator of protease activity HflC (stomatin/prohibitin superfamily)
MSADEQPVKLIPKTIVLASAILVIAVPVVSIFGLLFSFARVPVGNIGVLSTFGDVSDKVLTPGLHIVMPWNGVTRMSTQTQVDEEQASVPTRKGLAVGMKATMLYHLDSDRAPSMLREIGEGYPAVIAKNFRNAVRDVTAEFDAEAFYTGERVNVESRILDRISKELAPRGIEIESVMLLDPVLPDVVKSRIEAKMAAEQDATRMEYVLKQKRLEADAKVIEAKGIADSQSIIKKDLDDNYLRYLWISALKEHTGATIYIPTGGDGMPFFHPVHPTVPTKN